MKREKLLAPFLWQSGKLYDNGPQARAGVRLSEPARALSPQKKTAAKTECTGRGKE